MSKIINLNQDNLIPYPSTEDIERRDEQITEICRDINDINEFYKNLSTLVNQQEPNINSIEYHIEEAKCKTSEALQDLKKAEEYQIANPLTRFFTIASSTIIGTAIGGPIGMLMGLKAGCIATATTGAVLGGMVGKKLSNL